MWFSLRLPRKTYPTGFVYKSRTDNVRIKVAYRKEYNMVAEQVDLTILKQLIIFIE